MDRGLSGNKFFQYAIGALVAEDFVPGRSSLWERFAKREEARLRGEKVTDVAYGGKPIEKPKTNQNRAPGIGTPKDFREHMQKLADAGIDQVIFNQQGGRNKHEHICESLELFSSEVFDHFAEGRDEREARKAEELAPYIEAALARRDTRRPMEDDEIPVVVASRPQK